MYNDYYGFSLSPFENNLDQRFLFFSANHKEVIAALLYFIKWKKGFALVCGDVGTGKTMLINYLLNKLPDSVHPVLISNPNVGYAEILRYVAGILKIDTKGKRLLDLVDQVKMVLAEASRMGKRFVLIIDEAHLLSARSIEQIRLLSNIETQEQKLFQILLLGQYELSYKLNRPEMRQLRQRININRFLAPMDAAETFQYIEHRLKMAGSSFDACFESKCKHLIFKLTKGVPRSINQICDSALLICRVENLKKVSPHILKKADKALRSDILFTPRNHVGRSSSFWKGIRPVEAFSAGAVILILIGIIGYMGGLSERVQHFLYSLQSTIQAMPAVVSPPISGTHAVPRISPGTVNSSPDHSQILTDPSETKASEKDNALSSLASPETFSDENIQVLPTVKGRIEKESTTDSSAEEISSNGQQASQQKALESESAFPKEKKTATVSEQQWLVVKKGDTLMGIASQYFPDNKEDGLKKILAANPVIDDKDRIYEGQKIVIPEYGIFRKDAN